MEITKEPFGKTQTGEEITKYTLQNATGLRVAVINYGGIITSILTPDAQGKLGDIVLGFDQLPDYEGEHPFFGALIGRVANRIAKGQFSLDGQEYQVAINNGPNSLHGGLKGFDKVVWQIEALPENNSLKLSYLSKDGEENYPGNLTCTVYYTLTDENELRIDYHATTDKPTPVNLTNHSYFNLSAGEADDILHHELFLNADKYTVVDDDLTPTGELRPVEGTDMDFTSPKIIGSRIANVAGGYDHNYVLNKNGREMSAAARVYDPTSGREMEVYTTQPGVQFYSGNFLDGTLTGKYGHVYHKHYGLCLETQHFPDAPNQPSFPSIILRPGEVFEESTIYKFSVRSQPV